MGTITVSVARSLHPDVRRNGHGPFTFLETGSHSVVLIRYRYLIRRTQRKIYDHGNEPNICVVGATLLAFSSNTIIQDTEVLQAFLGYGAETRLPQCERIWIVDLCYLSHTRPGPRLILQSGTL